MWPPRPPLRIVSLAPFLCCLHCWGFAPGGAGLFSRRRPKPPARISRPPSFDLGQKGPFGGPICFAGRHFHKYMDRCIQLTNQTNHIIDIISTPLTTPHLPPPTLQIQQLKINGTVFIAGLSPETTEAQIVEYFAQIGIVKRQKQKRGYPDQWPYKIKVRFIFGQWSHAWPTLACCRRLFVLCFFNQAHLHPLTNPCLHLIPSIPIAHGPDVPRRGRDVQGRGGADVRGAQLGARGRQLLPRHGARRPQDQSLHRQLRL